MVKNPRCSFVVPGYRCDEYIFRNIASILDQDYKNYEIVVVLNGDWETRKELFSKLIEEFRDKIQLHWLPEGHLGRANNFGFSKATGDIISHLSSDLYLMPGALRTWIEAFEEHPECGLVYSGYRLVSNVPSDVYFSNEYDRYHLECENFIDGANPYRREFAAKWDESLKSLIDWDFALSVTEKTPAYYIKEPLYFAEKPKKGGLSMDSDVNWIARRRQIQGKHGIPDRKICICSLMDERYALEIAKMTGNDFRLYPGWKPHDYNLIYQYGYPSSLDMLRQSVGVFYGHWKHKIIHWVGPDILGLMNLPWKDLDYHVQMGLSKVGNHFCINSKDLQVLNRMHIESEIIYPPVVYAKEPQSIDSISVNDEELKYQLSKSMPDLDFRVNDLNCRLTIHFQDSVSNILKSICMGNHVITDRYLPGTYHIQAFSNVPELRKMITHTIRRHLKVKPEIEMKDVDDYRTKTKPEAFKRKLEKIAEKKINKYAKLDDIDSGMKGVFGEA